MMYASMSAVHAFKACVSTRAIARSKCIAGTSTQSCNDQQRSTTVVKESRMIQLLSSLYIHSITFTSVRNCVYTAFCLSTRRCST
eukprot:17099-Heterococcus_DN1.PRE.2